MYIINKYQCHKNIGCCLLWSQTTDPSRSAVASSTFSSLSRDVPGMEAGVFSECQAGVPLLSYGHLEYMLPCLSSPSRTLTRSGLQVSQASTLPSA